MIEKIEKFLLDALEHHKSRVGRIFGKFLVFLIFLSTATFVLETTTAAQKWKIFLLAIDFFVMLIFSAEFFLRILISCNRKKLFFSPIMIVDFFVLLAFYLHIFFPHSFFENYPNLVFLRSFRVLRIFQVLKILRYSNLMSSFLKSFKFYRDEIRIFVITFLMVLILSSCGLYFLEHKINENFATIPDAMWWAIVTISTVGYGDTVPITVGGKILASGVVWMGIATVAIMTALVTKIFMDHFFGKRMHHCEFCHYPHHDHDAKFCKNCGSQLDTEKLDTAVKIGRHNF